MASVWWLLVAVVVVWVAVKMAGGLASLFSALLIGAIAGWLAGKYMRGRGFGVVKNVLVGIIGAVIGGTLFGLLDLHPVSLIGSIVTATVGAIALLSFIRWLRIS
jgi:uncharacterized membrane protein YeaQ/YmgE (transglycosylase-associated protein family)